ncbi:MAG: DUF4032 domain-containing protein [Anaerolineae bacterium]
MGFDRDIRMAAKQNFRDARRQAFVNEIIAALSGKPRELLSFQEVQDRLGVKSCGLGRLEAVPLDKIVGSEGRYHDFDREFLPLHTGTEERWERLDVAYQRMDNVPPVDLYKVGDVYFVRDGNHRVSVARQHGVSFIDAYVTDCPSRIRLGQGLDVESLLVEEEHLGFLDRTHLDAIIGSDVQLTRPGAYDALERHLDGHRYFLGRERRADVSLEEAATSWYEHVYLPTVKVIRRTGVLERFPGRTEGDLYIWILEHLYYLREKYGENVSVEDAAKSFADHYGVKWHEKVLRWLVRRAAIIGGAFISWFRR